MTPTGHEAPFFVAMHATDTPRPAILSPVILGPGGQPHDAARFNHAARRRGDVAARSARAGPHPAGRGGERRRRTGGGMIRDGMVLPRYAAVNGLAVELAPLSGAAVAVTVAF